MSLKALLKTQIKGFPTTHGKVRDIYDLGSELFIVATDRISAFDVVMPNGIPDKGKILTQMSLFWFEFLGQKVKHHLISADVADFLQQEKENRKQLDMAAEQLRYWDHKDSGLRMAVYRDYPRAGGAQ